jgi:hypothetical protein
MISFKKVASTALIATTLAGAAVASTTQAEARCRFACGAAIGAVGGLIAGAALAQPAYPAYGAPVYVEEEPVYVAPPPPPPVVYRRAPAQQCTTSIRYDYQGRPFEWRDCN